MNLTGHNRRLRIKSTVGKGDSTNRIFPRPPGIWIMGRNLEMLPRRKRMTEKVAAAFCSCNLVEVKNERGFLITVML